MIKKSIKIVFILIIFITIIPVNVSAKTLGQLKAEYEALEKKYNDTSNSLKENEAEQSAANARIQSIYSELAKAEEDIKKLNEEIEKLNDDIKVKDKQTKELMKFFQLSQGESTYLEYIFSADSITDFIYRLSVTEQLSKYNDDLIDEMNKMITEKNNNITQLHEKEKSLAALQEELKEKLVVLSKEAEHLSDEEDSIEKDIEYSKSIINFYINAGCKESDDISTCANKQLPPGTRFWRPLNSGQMYSTWYSDVLSSGGCRSHAGVDIANSTGTYVYPIADGKVVYAGYASDGYGNKIIVQHNVNGQNYTSLYGHLSAIRSRVGDIVTKDTVIGLVGSTGNSQGPHLHLNLCVGLRSCVIRSDTVDPGMYINFPADKVWFRDRTTSYSGYYSDPCKWR